MTKLPLFHALFVFFHSSPPPSTKLAMNRIIKCTGVLRRLIRCSSTSSASVSLFIVLDLLKTDLMFIFLNVLE